MIAHPVDRMKNLNSNIEIKNTISVMLAIQWLFTRFAHVIHGNSIGEPIS
jgi:hypothetical protein